MAASSSSFLFVDVTIFSRSKSISKRNFVENLNSWLRYNYFRFGKNACHFGILLPVSISVISPQPACNVASGCRISSESDILYCKNMTSHRFFKMAAAATQYYCRFRICWCHCLQKLKIYHQILSTNLNSRLRYNYFRFPNTNVRHIGILLLISISTSSP